MNKVRLLCAAGLCGMVSLPLATSAEAAVSVTSPGLVCVEDNDNTPDIRYSFGNALNPVSAAETYNCPLTITNPISGNFFGSAVITDQTTAAGVSCFVRACNATGSVCSSSNTFSTATQFGAAWTGIISTGNLLVTGSANGYAYVRCTIPAQSGGNQSGVVSLSWLE